MRAQTEGSHTVGALHVDAPASGEGAGSVDGDRPGGRVDGGDALGVALLRATGVGVVEVDGHAPAELLDALATAGDPPHEGGEGVGGGIHHGQLTRAVAQVQLVEVAVEVAVGSRDGISQDVGSTQDALTLQLQDGLFRQVEGGGHTNAIDVWLDVFRLLVGSEVAAVRDGADSPRVVGPQGPLDGDAQRGTSTGEALDLVVELRQSPLEVDRVGFTVVVLGHEPSEVGGRSCTHLGFPQRHDARPVRARMSRANAAPIRSSSAARSPSNVD